MGQLNGDNWKWWRPVAYVCDPDWRAEKERMREAFSRASASEALADLVPALGELLGETECFLGMAMEYRRICERRRKVMEDPSYDDNALEAMMLCGAAIALLEPRARALRTLLGLGEEDR